MAACLVTLTWVEPEQSQPDGQPSTSQAQGPESVQSEEESGAMASEIIDECSTARLRLCKVRLKILHADATRYFVRCDGDLGVISSCLTR